MASARETFSNGQTFRSSNNLWFLRGLAGRDFWQINISIAAYWPR